MITSKLLVCLLVFSAGEVLAQNTETEVHPAETQTTSISSDTALQNATTIQPTIADSSVDSRRQIADEPNFFIKLYNTIVKAVQDFFNSPRVKTVLKNVGTCMVNGAMEILTYYVPAPMIPLIASAAGMIIPFEPVVTLREKMPVTSYRRAFNKAVNSFMGTFDKYKALDVEDPYMTNQFNRRFMNDGPEKKGKRVTEEVSEEEKRYI
ncbi:uncharacterized protein LOC125237250 [Leguminivora glycinivorella]|uniref:uncharacterized protein LOC125237250 n=1 Tax=Leguminivora glycinivorella TaxID=1035111 RepID=UPI00200CF9F4|nr:uncharacterized protein LOC125237250 [Leguminivora glycinivorella]XP_048000225.1 uncharacterized protein LOC125237250 [Leguminivora glycinivorella]